MPKVKVSIAAQGELDPEEHASQLRTLTALMGSVGLEGWPKDRTAGWRFAARMTGLGIVEPIIGSSDGMALDSPENLVRNLQEILYPGGDLDHEFDMDDLEEVARLLRPRTTKD